MSSVFERNPKKTLLFVILVLICGFDLALAHLFPRADSEIRVPSKIYHHDLLPNVRTKLKWGDATYTISTNSLGFKDEIVRAVPRVPSNYRILFIGDSFTEGIGNSFEQTFVGRISHKLLGQAEVLNAGVASYSPKLYYLKVKDLLENRKLIIDEVVVFIDISDIQDEITYSGFNKKVYYGDMAEKFMLDNSIIARWLSQRGVISKVRRFLGFDFVLPNQIDQADFQQHYFQDRGRWTYDPAVYEKWGALGVKFAIKNMDELYRLLSARKIKMSIAVYPWPEQIMHHDLNSRQVTIWRKFCQERNIPFLNYFPVFITSGADASEIVSKYYIKSDVHWNDKGHALVAEQWLKFRCGLGKFESATCFHH
jgi:lysophospholipase L1-like esterase